MKNLLFYISLKLLLTGYGHFSFGQTISSNYDTPPVFSLGDRELNGYIAKELKLSDSDYRAMRDDQILISFTVELDSSISDIRIIKGGTNYRDWIIDAFENMPPWIPATLNGSPVRASLTLPVMIIRNPPFYRGMFYRKKYIKGEPESSFYSHTATKRLYEIKPRAKFNFYISFLYARNLSFDRNTDKFRFMNNGVYEFMFEFHDWHLGYRLWSNTTRAFNSEKFNADIKTIMFGRKFYLHSFKKRRFLGELAISPHLLYIHNENLSFQDISKNNFGGGADLILKSRGAGYCFVGIQSFSSLNSEKSGNTANLVFRAGVGINIFEYLNALSKPFRRGSFGHKLWEQPSKAKAPK